MKRSEMVKIMGEWLGSEYGDLSNHEDLLRGMTVAKGLLYLIEQEGMIPPFNKQSYYLDGDNANQKSTTYHTWEEE